MPNKENANREDEIKVELFNSSSYTGPTTEDLVNRAHSLIDAISYLLDKKAGNEKVSAEFVAGHWKKYLAEQIGKRFNISNQLALLNRDKQASAKCLATTCAKFEKYLNDWLFSKWIYYVRRPGESEVEAVARLREAENEYVSVRQQKNRPAPLHHEIILPAEGDVLETKHFSRQERLEHNIQNCYQRKGGLANLKKQTAGHFEGDTPVTDIEFYSHTSVVPLLDKQLDRLNGAMDASKELLTVLAEEHLARSAKEGQTFEGLSEINLSLTEIRLLSVYHRRLAPLVELVNPQPQFQQTLEAYLAFNMFDDSGFDATVACPNGEKRKVSIKADISFMNFGANWVSFKLPNDPLQDWINTRGFNQLWDNFFVCLPTQNVSNAFTLEAISLDNQIRLEQPVQAVNDGRKKLACVYKNLQDNLQNYQSNVNGNRTQWQKLCQQQLKDIEHAVKKQHKLEENLLNIRKELWQQRREKIRQTLASENLLLNKNVENNKCYQLWQDFADIQELYFSEKYKTPEYNYRLQALLAELNYKMGRQVAIGCFDGVDRTGRLANTIEAQAAIKHRNDGVNPDLQKIKGGIFNKIVNLFHRFSSSLPGTEQSSVPGKRGFQIYERDGNHGLDPENRYIAQLGKDIFTPSFSCRVKHVWMKAKRWLNGPVYTPSPVTTTAIVKRPALTVSKVFNFGYPLLANIVKSGLVLILALAFNLNPAIAGGMKKNDALNSNQKRESSEIKDNKKSSDAVFTEERRNGKQETRRHEPKKDENSDSPLLPVDSRSDPRKKDDDRLKDGDDQVNNFAEDLAPTSGISPYPERAKVAEFFERHTEATKSYASKTEEYSRNGMINHRQRIFPLTDSLRREETRSLRQEGINRFIM